MMSMRTIALVLCLVLPMPAALSQEKEEWPVTRIYEVKYRSPGDIAKLLEGFGIKISVSDAFKTISLMTIEKQHAVIAELIRKYDVPARTIELQFHLVRASAAGAPPKETLPAGIRGVIHEIATLTRYKTFELLDTPVLRATEGKDASLTGQGHYEYAILIGRGGPSIVALDKKREIRLDAFTIRLSVPVTTIDGKLVYRNVGVETALSIGDGESVVVGASQIQAEAAGAGAAIITIVSARILP